MQLYADTRSLLASSVTRTRRVGASAFCVMLATLPAHVLADVSGTVTLTSDYRFRGISLSAEKPAVEFSLDYDQANGGYAGTLISTLQVSDPAQRSIGVLAYGGYAKRYGTFNLEGGASYATFPGNHEYDYPEIYGGVTSQRSSARLYFARRYFGQASNTQYLEFNTTRPIQRPWAVVCHVGLLHTHDALSNRDHAYHYDFRVGLSLAMDNTSAQLAWVTAQRISSQYPVTGAQQRHAVILSITHAF